MSSCRSSLKLISFISSIKLDKCMMPKHISQASPNYKSNNFLPSIASSLPIVISKASILATIAPAGSYVTQQEHLLALFSGPSSKIKIISYSSSRVVSASRIYKIFWRLHNHINYANIPQSNKILSKPTFSSNKQLIWPISTPS